MKALSVFQFQNLLLNRNVKYKCSTVYNKHKTMYRFLIEEMVAAASVRFLLLQRTQGCRCLKDLPEIAYGEGFTHILLWNYDITDNSVRSF